MDSRSIHRTVVRGALGVALIGVALAVGGTGSAGAAACTTSWASAQDGDWNDAGKWTAGVPTSSSVACIAVAGTYTVHVEARTGDLTNAAAAADELQLGAASGTQTIEVKGAFVNSAARDASLVFGSGGTVGTHGTIVLDSSAAGAGARLRGGSSGLTNSGTIATQPGAGGARELGRKITNQSTISIGADTASEGGADKLELQNTTGTVAIAANKTLALGAATFVNFSSAHTTVTGALTGSGGLLASTGTFAGNAPVLTDEQLGVSSGTGTFVLHGNSVLSSHVGSGVTVRAEGTASADATITTDGGPVQNGGTIRLTSTSAAHGARLSATSDTITNTGTIATEAGAGGVRELGRAITNQNTISIGADTASEAGADKLNLQNTTGTVAIAAGKTLALGAATFVAGFSSQTTVTGALTGSGGLLATVGTFSGNAPVLTDEQLGASSGSGTFVLHGNSVLNSNVGSGVTVRAEGTPSADATITTDGGTVQNGGTIRLTSTNGAHGARLRASSGTLTNASTGTIETQPGAGGFRELGRTMVNQGTLLIGADTASESGADELDLTQSGGTLSVDANLTYLGATLPVTGGTVKGVGTITAPTVDNSGGTVAPGHSPGILTINGDYTQGPNGELDVQINGPAAGTQFSRLSVSGTASLDGDLRVTSPGTQAGAFRVLQAGARSGEFASVIAGQTFATSYDSTGLTLLGAPANTAKPTISGTPSVGSTLTCSQGTWTLSPTSFAFRWKRNGSNISGATSSTYKVLAADQGHALTCQVTATNASGSTAAESSAVVPGLTQPGTFGKTHLRATKKGVVKVPVANPNPLGAAGKLTLKRKGKKVGSATFTITAKGKKTVRVKLNKKTRKALKKKGQLKIAAVLVLSRDGVQKTASKTLTVKKPKS
jgi:fibronectin-binding autotransporter adhesin